MEMSLGQKKTFFNIFKKKQSQFFFVHYYSFVTTNHLQNTSKFMKAFYSYSFMSLSICEPNFFNLQNVQNCPVSL